MIKNNVYKIFFPFLFLILIIGCSENNVKNTIWGGALNDQSGKNALQVLFKPNKEIEISMNESDSEPIKFSGNYTITNDNIISAHAFNNSNIKIDLKGILNDFDGSGFGEYNIVKTDNSTNSSANIKGNWQIRKIGSY